MTKKIDIHALLRDCYLHAEPSVDIDAIPDGVQLNCTDYRLKQSVYDALLRDHGVTDEHGNANDPDTLLGVNLYVMNIGPTWVDDLKAA